MKNIAVITCAIITCGCLIAFLLIMAFREKPKYYVQCSVDEKPGIILTLDLDMNGYKTRRKFFLKDVHKEPEGLRSWISSVCGDGVNSSSIISYELKRISNSRFLIEVNGHARFDDQEVKVDQSIPASFMVNSTGKNIGLTWSIKWMKLDPKQKNYNRYLMPY